MTRQAAFTAYADTIRHYSLPGFKVQFDGVKTNIGGHFVNATTFTCPVDGLYYFSFHVMSHDSVYDSKVSLMLGGTRVVSPWADHHVTGHHAQASNSALVVCSAGQDVYLMTNSNTYVYSNSFHLSTFSGFLVSEN